MSGIYSAPDLAFALEGSEAFSMPAAGKRWRHVIINTKRTWLPGDPRGFRNRDHRIHSSGDYKNPPPEGEHEGLHAHYKAGAGPEVKIPLEYAPLVGRTLLEHYRLHEYRVLALSVAIVHSHALVELPDHMGKVKEVVGHAKRKSSRALKSILPGSVWAAGGTYKPVDSRPHQQNVCDYILYKQGPHAWTWSFKDHSDEGQFARKRPRPG